MNGLCAAPAMERSAAARPATDGPLRHIQHHRRHPLSRWYLCPAADALARRLRSTGLRPNHCTLLGLVVVAVGVGVLLMHGIGPMVAALVLAAWFCDRLDGGLARVQGTATRFGAWLDAQSDELADVLWHTAAAAALAMHAVPHAWLALAAMLSGKYLFFYARYEAAAAAGGKVASSTVRVESLVRRLYHAPSNADVRVHLLAAGLALDLMLAELWLVAVYYHVRWIVCGARLARHQAGGAP